MLFDVFGGVYEDYFGMRGFYSIFASEQKKKTFEVICVNHYVNRRIVEYHKKTAKSLIDGAIAQLVEQRTENPCVPGSIPGGTTKKRLIESLFL